MSIFEYDEDGHMRVLQEEAREEGYGLGREEGYGLGKEEGYGLGKEEGYGLGKEEGYDLGKSAGKEAQAMESARKFYNMGINIDDISKGVGYTVDTVSKWLGLIPAH